MSYKILDINNIQEYLFSLPEIKSFFSSDSLEVKEIGDGNLNFVFLATSSTDSSKSLIVKQAVPYLRCVGEEYPLSKERMTYEIRSLERFSKLSRHIPKIYHSDEDMSVVVMEYLSEHIIMRKGMIESTLYPNFSEHISSYLANTLFKTSSLYLSSREKAKLVSAFIDNSELCKLTEDFVFSAPYMVHETNASLPELADIATKISNDVELKTKILELKYKFMNQSDALIHGDLHTGSIMVNQDDTYVFDSEFAFVGPMAFDIGALIANLVMSWVSHNVQDEKADYQEWIVETITTIWNKFSTKFITLWNETGESALLIDGYASKEVLKAYQTQYMSNLLQDSIGFAGCKVMRRQLGIAGVEDIREIDDPKTREKANRLALKIGEKFIKEYKNIETIKDVIGMLK
ncbi:MAG: S-methyl-5-thioribose kinase [Campylobacterota bacterium]